MKPTNNIVGYQLEASEFNWESRPGKTIRARGFSQQVPGPTLKADECTTVIFWSTMRRA